MSIPLYSRVKFIGEFDQFPMLKENSYGYVIEDYEDGNYEVEFSDEDGVTYAQIVLPETLLVIS